MTLLAGYHTAYSVIGVAVLLPLLDRFTRVVERILPERRSPLTRCLDPAALVTPLAAEEAVRRTVARAPGTMCGSIVDSLTPAAGVVSVGEASDALRQAREFISEANGPPDSETEQERLTSTPSALDCASRLAEVAGDIGGVRSATGSAEDERAVTLCDEAMRQAVVVADDVGALPDAAEQPATDGAPARRAIVELERCATALRELQPLHRTVTLRSVAAGSMNADEALARVDIVRRLDAITRHAWRSAAHLVDSRHHDMSRERTHCATTRGRALWNAS